MNARRTERDPLRASEHAEQAALFRWAEFARVRWPELALLHAIPNGGHRNKVAAGRLKAEGVKPGVPDTCLPVARCGFHGLYVELKAKGGTASSHQRAWIVALRAQGYRAEVCVGWRAAREVIEQYLAGNPTNPTQGARP